MGEPHSFPELAAAREAMQAANAAQLCYLFGDGGPRIAVGLDLPSPCYTIRRHRICPQIAQIGFRLVCVGLPTSANYLTPRASFTNNAANIGSFIKELPSTYLAESPLRVVGQLSLIPPRTETHERFAAVEAGRGSST